MVPMAEGRGGLVVWLVMTASVLAFMFCVPERWVFAFLGLVKEYSDVSGWMKWRGGGGRRMVEGVG